MIKEIFDTIVYKPLYNGLVLLLSVVPAANVGYAIILLTIVVRGVLLPFSHKSITSQKKIQSLDGHIKTIREKHTNKQDQAARIMELYKEHGVNPLSGCLFLLIQLPIIFALYWVFGHGIVSGTVDTTLLYSFVHPPEAISFHFLSFNLIEKSLFLALCAGVTQYIQMKLSLPPPSPTSSKQKEGKVDFSEEFKNALAIQSRYILPAMIFIFAWQFPAAIALYWTVNNLFSIVHELGISWRAKRILAKT